MASRAAYAVGDEHQRASQLAARRGVEPAAASRRRRPRSRLVAERLPVARARRRRAQRSANERRPCAGGAGPGAGDGRRAPRSVRPSRSSAWTIATSARPSRARPWVARAAGVGRGAAAPAQWRAGRRWPAFSELPFAGAERRRRGASSTGLVELVLAHRRSSASSAASCRSGGGGCAASHVPRASAGRGDTAPRRGEARREPDAGQAARWWPWPGPGPAARWRRRWPGGAGGARPAAAAAVGARRSPRAARRERLGVPGPGLRSSAGPRRGRARRRAPRRGGALRPPVEGEADGGERGVEGLRRQPAASRSSAEGRAQRGIARWRAARRRGRRRGRARPMPDGAGGEGRWARRRLPPRRAGSPSSRAALARGPASGRSESQACERSSSATASSAAWRGSRPEG